MAIFEEFSVIERDGAQSIVLVNTVARAQEMVGAHWHDSYELLYIRRGACHQWLQGRLWSLAAGDVFLAAPRQVHATTATGADGCSIDVVKFAADLPGERMTGGLYAVSGAGQRIVAEQFAGLTRESEESDAAHGAVERGMILTLLALLARHCPDRPRPAHDLTQYDVVQRAAHYMEENMRSPITLTQTAAHFGYTPEHLSRLFRKATGGTFKAYADEIKLDAAVTMMYRENLSVTETACALGFNSTAAFIRSFRRRYGYPPRRYIAMFREVQRST